MSKNKEHIQRKIGLLIAYATMMISTIVTFLYTPIMLRMLGQSEYGIYSLSSATVAYLSVLSFGFGSSYVKFYTKYSTVGDEDGIAILNGMFMVVFSVIGGVALVLGSILVVNIKNIFGTGLTHPELLTLQIVMSVMVINTAITFPTSIINSYLTANERFIFQRIWGLIVSVCTPLLTLLLLVLGLKSIAMSILALLITLGTAIVRYVYVKKILNFRCSFKKFDYALFNELKNFSILVFINILADQVNWNIDRVLLGIYKGTSEVAIYGVATTFNQYFRYSVITGLSVFETMVSIGVAAGDSNKVFTELVARTGRISFMILSLVFSGFLIFGKEFILLYYGGESYRNAYYIAAILMGASLIPLVFHMGSIVQEAQNKHKYRTMIYSITAVGNLLLTIPMIKLFGGIGAAMATAIAVVVGDVILINLIYHYKVGINMIYVIKKVAQLLHATIYPILFGCLIHFFVEITSISVLAYLIGVYMVIYGISFWFLGMNNEEKGFITHHVVGLLNVIKNR